MLNLAVCARRSLFLILEVVLLYTVTLCASHTLLLWLVDDLRISSRFVCPQTHNLHHHAPRSPTLQQTLAQLPPQHFPPGHERATETPPAEAVSEFGRLAEQSPLTSHEPKGFMTVGSNTANPTSRRSRFFSTTTEGDQPTTPPAAQAWERGDLSLASQLLSQNREARGDGLLC